MVRRIGIERALDWGLLPYTTEIPTATVDGLKIHPSIWVQPIRKLVHGDSPVSNVQMEKWVREMIGQGVRV